MKSLFLVSFINKLAVKKICLQHVLINESSQIKLNTFIIYYYYMISKIIQIIIIIIIIIISLFKIYNLAYIYMHVKVPLFGHTVSNFAKFLQCSLLYNTKLVRLQF